VADQGALTVARGHRVPLPGGRAALPAERIRTLPPRAWPAADPTAQTFADKLTGSLIQRVLR